VRSAKPPSRTAARAPAEGGGIDRLFVYGSLMRGFPLHPLLRTGAEFVAPGCIRGALVDLGAYPGAVPAASGAVRGELYRVRRADLWSALDYAEGPQYHRAEVAVDVDGGRAEVAFVYWYRGPLDRGVPIPSGDYRAHAPARSIHYIPRNPGGS
jgi:gamma-glutamylcyclotransferase (GGCT)/AIG2-like uncharacterized protein YtfP